MMDTVEIMREEVTEYIETADAKVVRNDAGDA
jgi:hypothetical protein